MGRTSFRKIQRGAWWFLALAYLFVRFTFSAWLDEQGTYTSIAAEFVLVCIGIFLYGRTVIELFKIRLRIVFVCFGFLPIGLIVFEGTGLLNAQLPIPLVGFDILFFLLCLAPIVEEGIFRFFLWQPLAAINQKAAWVFTSLIFSYSHLHSIWSLPSAFHRFIIYQTCYTLLLGFFCGYLVYRHRSLSAAVLAHFFFNAGFYIGTLI